jgi:transglutaminase superfamily protein
MRRLKRLIHLPNIEKRLLFEAALTILIIRIMLKYLTLANLHRAVVVAPGIWRSSRACAPHRIANAIDKAARLIARSNCLIQALAGQALLARYGCKAFLTVGVARDEDLSFEAHAWVTTQDQVLIGACDTSHYTAILRLECLP